MVGMGILANNVKFPSTECYTTFWRMTIYSVDTLHGSGITPILTLLLNWILLRNLTFYQIARGFHRTFTKGVTCQQRTLTPPDTWSCPTLGLACVRFEFRTSLGTFISLRGTWHTNIQRLECGTCRPWTRLFMKFWLHDNRKHSILITSVGDWQRFHTINSSECINSN